MTVSLLSAGNSREAQKKWQINEMSIKNSFIFWPNLFFIIFRFNHHRKKNKKNWFVNIYRFGLERNDFGLPRFKLIEKNYFTTPTRKSSRHSRKKIIELEYQNVQICNYIFFNLIHLNRDVLMWINLKCFIQINFLMRKVLNQCYNYKYSRRTHLIPLFFVCFNNAKEVRKV